MRRLPFQSKRAAKGCLAAAVHRQKFLCSVHEGPCGLSPGLDDHNWATHAQLSAPSVGNPGLLGIALLQGLHPHPISAFQYPIQPHTTRLRTSGSCRTQRKPYETLTNRNSSKSKPKGPKLLNSKPRRRGASAEPWASLRSRWLPRGTCLRLWVWGSGIVIFLAVFAAGV